MQTYRLLNGAGGYGKLAQDFQIDLEDTGYYVITGPNNSGKSSVLQLLFAQIGDSLYVPSERGIVRSNLGSDTQRLDDYINNLRQAVSSAPLDSAILGMSIVSQGGSQVITPFNTYLQCLLPSMMRNSGLRTSLNGVAARINDFGIGSDLDSPDDNIIIDGQQLSQYGAGTRSLLTIIVAVMHSRFNTILIDEPELFLEPHTQKLLKSFLLEHAVNKRIVVASHSHIFLNRDKKQHNRNYYYVPTEIGSVFQACAGDEDLRMLIFRLLGASFDDLMLPENYLVVEGPSDASIVGALAALLDKNKATKLQVVYSQGIGNSLNTVNAIEEMLRPNYAEKSAYSQTVVCLLDEPAVENGEETTVKRLAGLLNTKNSTRLFTLGKNDAGESLYLEKMIPDQIYLRTGLNKADVLAELDELKKDKSKTGRIALGSKKAQVSEMLAKNITITDVDSQGFEILKQAIIKAFEPID